MKKENQEMDYLKNMFIYGCIFLVTHKYRTQNFNFLYFIYGAIIGAVISYLCMKIGDIIDYIISKNKKDGTKNEL